MAIMRLLKACGDPERGPEGLFDPGGQSFGGGPGAEAELEGGSLGEVVLQKPSGGGEGYDYAVGVVFGLLDAEYTGDGEFLPAVCGGGVCGIYAAHAAGDENLGAGVGAGTESCLHGHAYGEGEGRGGECAVGEGVSEVGSDGEAVDDGAVDVDHPGVFFGDYSFEDYGHLA